MDISKQEVLNCMFSEWYPKFSHLTMKSVVINLPESFVNYLQDNGTIILPKGAALDTRAERDSEDEEDWSDEEDDNPEEGSSEFPEVIEAIKETLANLNYKVFPKLNWSAPKDAVWITASNNLKCTSPGDIILLLKSSDFVTYDLTSPFKLCRSDNNSDPPHEKQGNFWIIDFNPWGLMNDPLLFTWEELEDFDVNQLSNEDCPILTTDGETVGIFRYASKNLTIQPSEVLSHRVPQDFLDLSRGEDATKLIDFLRMKIQSEEVESSDDEEPWQLPSNN